MSGLARFLQWASSHLYGDLAWSYDAVAWLVSMGQWGDWQRAGLRWIPDGRILELGPGPGHLLRALSHDGRPAVGIDPSPQMVRQARRNLRNARVPLNLIRGQAQSLPLPPAGFAAVLSSFPSEYVLDPAVYGQVRRVLEPGGLWVIVATAIVTGRSLPDRFTRWWTTLLRQTGELPEAFLRPFSQAGFEIQIERVTLRRAVVVCILARPSPESNSARS